MSDTHAIEHTWLAAHNTDAARAPSRCADVPRQPTTLTTISAGKLFMTVSRQGKAKARQGRIRHARLPGPPRIF